MCLATRAIIWAPFIARGFITLALPFINSLWDLFNNITFKSFIFGSANPLNSENNCRGGNRTLKTGSSLGPNFVDKILVRLSRFRTKEEA